MTFVCLILRLEGYGLFLDRASPFNLYISHYEGSESEEKGNSQGTLKIVNLSAHMGEVAMTRH